MVLCYSVNAAAALGGSFVWLPAVGAALVGFASEYANYAVTKSVLARGASASFVIPLRALIAAACMLLCFFAANILGISPGPLLIGCAVGLSAGLVVFTLLLMKGGES